MANGLDAGDSIKGSDKFKFFRGERASLSPGERDVEIDKLVEYLNDPDVLTAVGGGLSTVTASDIDPEAATDGQVLTSDGAGNAAWEDPAVTSAQLQVVQNNVVLNAMRQLIDNGGSLYNMQDQFVDTFTDETGVDTATSTNEYYDPNGGKYSSNLVSLADLYIEADATAGSQTFTDLSPNGFTVSAINQAQHDTAQSAVGTSSVLFDGSGDELRVAHNALLEPNANDFTVQFDVRFNTTPAADQDLFGKWGASAGAFRIQRNNASNVFRFDLRGGGTSPNVDGTTTISTGTWYHVACVRDGNTARLYINGVQEASDATLSGALTANASVGIVIGATTGFRPLDGWIDNIFYSVGTCLYPNGTTFTPPSVAYGAGNMTLVSVSQTADAVPSTARCVLKINDNGTPVTLNTDLFVDFSRDGGSTWTNATLRDQGTYSGNIQIFDTDSTDISAQPSGTDMRIRVRTANSVYINVEDWGLQWA